MELAFLIDKSRWGGLATGLHLRSAIIRTRLGLSRLICLTTRQRGSIQSFKAFEREHDDELGLCRIYALS